MEPLGSKFSRGPEFCRFWGEVTKGLGRRQCGPGISLWLGQGRPEERWDWVTQGPQGAQASSAGGCRYPQQMVRSATPTSTSAKDTGDSRALATGGCGLLCHTQRLLGEGGVSE